MLECNRYIHKKLATIGRFFLILLPLLCAVLLLSQVVLAENAYVLNDDGRTVVHTSHATDPVKVLEEAGLRLGPADTYVAELGPGVLEITVRRSKTVQILWDGEDRILETYAVTVEELLGELQITLGARDAVNAALTDKITEGMRLEVLRCTTREENYSVALPMNTLYYYDENLDEGEEVVLRKGHAGRMELLELVTLLGDREVGRETVRQTDLCGSVDRIVVTGSRDADVVGPIKTHIRQILSVIAPEYDVSCGLPYIGGGLIVATDGEVFYYSDELQVKATAYHNSDPGCTIYTAIGTLCRVGAIAVDPKVIPYGTRMFIVTNDGKYVYGEAVAEDCGGAIKGNRIDLYFDTVAECSKFGVRQAMVYFLDGFTLESQ